MQKIPRQNLADTRGRADHDNQLIQSVQGTHAFVIRQAISRGFIFSGDFSRHPLNLPVSNRSNGHVLAE
jgi:hypothetical protein